MSKSNDTAKELLSCPVCSQLIVDPSKIRAELTRALANPQVLGAFLHGTRSLIHATTDLVEHSLRKAAIRENRESFQIMDRVARNLRDLHDIFEFQVDLIRQPRNNRVLNEQEIDILHRSFDKQFRMSSVVNISGLGGHSFQTPLSEYRMFLQTIMELAFMAVGRLPQPRVEIQYNESGDHVDAQLILREAGEEELDDVHFQIAALLAAKSALSFESLVLSPDRVFRWSLPMAKTDSLG